MKTNLIKQRSPILILAKESKIIEQALAALPHQFLVVKDAAEVLSLCQAQYPVLLILDDIAIVQRLAKTMTAKILLICDAEYIDLAFEAGSSDCYIGAIHPQLLERRVHFLLQSIPETEIALHESEIRYQSLFESANDGILLIDVLTEKIIGANPQAARMLGYTCDEIRGIPIQEIEYLLELEESSNKGLSERGHLVSEALYKRQDGSMMPVETSSCLMVFDGQPTIVSFLRDGSERKHAFEAEQSQRHFAEALLDTTAALNRETELDAVLDAILANISRVLPVENASVMLYEDGWITVTRHHAYTDIGLENNALDNLRFKVEHAPNMRWSLEHKQANIVNDTESEGFEWASSITANVVKSILTAPIILGENVIGFINLDSTEKNSFDDEHRHKLQAFANQAAVAIQNARLFQQIQEQMDGLEARVIERTAELSKANVELREQILQRQVIEDVLEEERTLLRVLIGNIPDQVYVKDKSGTILLSNQAAKQFISQAQSDNPISNPDTAFVSDTELTDLFHEQEMDIMRRGKALINFETSYHDRYGEQRWILTTKVPLLDAQNMVVGLVGINRDITELKKSQTQLAEERTLLRTIIDTIPEAIYVKDLQNRFVLVNAATMSNMGVANPDDILGKTNFDFIDEKDAQRFQEDEIAIMTSGNPQINQQLHFIGQNGKQNYFLTTKLPLYDSQGHIIGLIGINHDISELKQAEARLAQVLRSAQCLLWSATIEQSEDEHYLWGVQVVNEEAAQSFLPLDTSECSYVEAWQAAILPEDRIRRIYVAETHLRFNILNYSLEFRVKLKNGFEHWLAEEVVLQSAGEGRWYAVGVCTDISDRKEVERRLQEINEELEQRVQERTTELTLTNTELRQEVLERKRAEDAERQQRILAETLRENIAKISSTLDRDAVFDHLLTAIKAIIPYDGANIMLYENGMITIVQTHGYKIDLVGRTYAIQEYPDLIEVLKTNEPYYIPDVSRYEHWKNFESLDWIESNISIPILIEGTIIGFLNLDSAVINGFTNEHTQLLMTFASQTGIAIRNARYTAELEKRVQERTQDLESEKAQLQAILNAMRDGLIYTNKEREIQYINHSLTEITGYSEEEWLNGNVGDQIRIQFPEELAEIREKIELKLAHQGYWRGQVLLRRKDTSTFDGELTRTLVNNSENNRIGLVTVVRDISDQKRLDEQKKRFVATAAHELRTPIANMKTRLFLMKRKPETFMEHIAVAESVADLMQNLVEDMFDISRFERGIISLDPEKMVLQDLVKEVLEYQQPEAERQRIALKSVLPETAIHIFADPYRLTQVIINLVGNGLHYTPVGGEVRLEVEQIDEAVLLRVIDNGEGIDPESIEHLFEPFFRASSDKKGAGLGLAIVHEIVSLHGGTIAVESEPGKGSSFIIRLPLSALEVKTEMT
jgi:PAS domain S-box-containing protein